MTSCWWAEATPISRCCAPGRCGPSRACASPWGSSGPGACDRPGPVSSGVVPGLVAGQYRHRDLEIDVRPLALRAGARCVNAAAVGFDPAERAILLDGRPPLRYDTAVFDVGSTVA